MEDTMIVKEYINKYPILASSETSIRNAIDIIKESLEKGGKVLVCGNGGSCSDADHICGEFLKGFLKKRKLDKKIKNKMFEIYGEKGSIILEGGKIKAWNILGEESPADLQANHASGASDPMAIDFKLHLAQIKDMVEAINEDKDPLVTGEIGSKSLEVILGIYRSSQEKQTVNL